MAETQGDDRERAEELAALGRLLRGGEEGSGPPRAAKRALLAGRFELEARIGRGPHGEVFSVRDAEHQGRALALKRLDPAAGSRPEAPERLAEHAERLRALDHEAFVRVRAAGRDREGRLYLASDLVQGESVRALLERRGALPPRLALEIARQVLSALEVAHARGSAHGALHAENVLLANRVPWTEENPFGVGVRLTDHGLAAWRGEDISPERDLADVASLLAELVSGTRPAGHDWAALRASLRDVDVRGLLDRSFPDARSFRAAIESSPAWRPRRRSRGRPLAALAGILALVLLGLLVRERRRRVEASAPARLAEETRPAASELAGLAERPPELEGENSTIPSRGEADADETADLRERSRQLEDDLARTRAELEEARRALAGSDEPRPAPAASLEAACLALERVLERIAERDLEGAHASALAAAEEASLADLGFETRFLERATAAALALERAARETLPLPGVETLLEARALLREARLEREAFLVRAAPWLDLPPDEEPRRRARCLSWFEGLGTELLEHAPELERRWTALADGPAEPRAVLALARWFDDGRLESHLERLAGELSGACESEGRLQLEPLAAARVLDAWGELGGELLSSGAGGAEVLRFAYARRFAFPPQRSECLPPWSLPACEVDTGWREALALSREILEPSSAFPGRAGSLRLFHVRTGGGEESWIVESVSAGASGSSAGPRWDIEQRFHDAAGRETLRRGLVLERQGKRFLERGSRSRELVDLSWSSPRVRVFEPGFDGPVPERLGFSAREVERFRSELLRSPRRALVVEDDGEETWLTSDLGLVRYRAPDFVVRELVYAEVSAGG